MSDHCEEQEMEAEALAAIFDTAFTIQSDTQPFEWSVKLLPVDCGGDEEEEEAQNHVGITLHAKIPLDYPETSLPELNVEIIKGLTEEHRVELVEMAQAEAANNEAMPAIYAICEVLREWLADHNTKGLDDASMYASMMRRAKEEERKKVRIVKRVREERASLLLVVLATNCSMWRILTKRRAISRRGQDPVVYIVLSWECRQGTPLKRNWHGGIISGRHFC